MRYEAEPRNEEHHSTPKKPMPQISTPKLAVVFAKATDNPDRWSHQIFLTDRNQQTLLLSSIEGTDEQAWPASAPLQDISQHDLPTGQAILGVGMAGKSHWSASVSVEQNTTLFFDMACLIKTAEASVGSRYAVATGVEAEMIGESLMLQTPSSKIAIQPHHRQNQRTKFISQGTEIAMIPDVETKSLTGSVRWCFRISVE